ncbi:MAG: PfkB family carbohydrate kinase, partial [Thermoplasmata archaeon]
MTGSYSGSADRGDLLVSGHINVDHFLYVHRFPGVDRTVPILSERRVLGGTAANIARVAASYGIRTGVRARIGGDFPEEFLRALRASRIDTEGIEMVRRELTPTCYTTVDDRHEQRTMIEQGSMADEPR